MKRWLVWLLAAALLLSGCSAWQGGSYHSTTPHQEKENQSAGDIVAVSSYSALYRVLVNMIHNGTTSGLISVKNYNQLVVAKDMVTAVQRAKQVDPIAVYAVKDIQFDLGTNAGQPAIAVNISYYHDRGDLEKIHHLENAKQAEQVIAEALNQCESGIVLHIDEFDGSDLGRWVEDYSDANPHLVMEKPRVSVNLYPKTGEERIVELKFSYQNSREALRSMQGQVQNRIQHLIADAKGEPSQQEQYLLVQQLLTQNLTNVSSSITPAYSLLMHGVGDSGAISKLFAAICKQVDLTCITVTGTWEGKPRYWNIVSLGGVHFHVDVLGSTGTDMLILKTDDQMVGYVWDYSAYPACSGVPGTG